MEPSVKRFACTQCGKCCNRSPEVELSEAAALCDVFVFRLMFRLYWLPQELSHFRSERGAGSSATFYGRKRLLNAFAARKSQVKLRRDGTRIGYTKYLMISALALDTSPGACGALEENQCSIYDRRPLGCRSVPLHYSRPEALAEDDLKAFVETPGHCCDTSETSPVIVSGGQIVAEEINKVRSDALRLAEHDRSWSEAIVRRMSGASPRGGSLPSLEEVEAASHSSAVTTSMRVAWQIAAEAGIIDEQECDRLVALQLALVEQELLLARCSRDARETLSEMRGEYRHHLSGRHALAAHSSAAGCDERVGTKSLS